MLEKLQQLSSFSHLSISKLDDDLWMDGWEGGWVSG
jgi:hypothetical protein